MYRYCLLLALSTTIQTAAADSGLQPQDGLWEITTQTETVGSPPPPAKISHACYSKQDIEKLHVATGGDNKCTIDDYRLVDNAASWSIRCGESGEIFGKGTLTFAGPTAYRGSLELHVKRPEQAEVTINNRYSARRTGDCTK